MSRNLPTAQAKFEAQAPERLASNCMSDVLTGTDSGLLRYIENVVGIK